MPSFKVTVKWGKEKYSNVDLSTEESPDTFKLQLYSLTNVLPERQKVMLKGMTIKETWENAKLKNGITLLMMGTAEELPQAPTTKTVFLEDMTDDQLLSAMDLCTGLENLGNTCYMNSTVQFLKSVPELEQALQSFSGGVGGSGLMASLGGMGGGNIDNSITASFRDLVAEMNSQTQSSIKPFIFLQLLYMRFPQFAEKNEHGHPMQQDANEFLTQLLRICQEKLTTDGEKKSNVITQYFGVENEVKKKCADENALDEPATTTTETNLQLNCFISQDVKFLLTGIKSALQEEITMNSPSLGRNANYLKTSTIKRLPAYLCVQMVRFYFKQKGNVNAKILKDVKFPLTFDAYDLCSPELQTRLKPARDKFEAEEEAKAEAQLAGKLAGKQPSKPAPGKSKDEPPKEYERYDFPDDIGSNNSGHYELQAVITHQGRSSSSGHYVAWIRRSGDDWLKCDDDHVTPVTSEEVLKLSGGGDWHIAYVLLYGPRRLEKKAGETSSNGDVAENPVSESTSAPMDTDAPGGDA